MSLATRAVAAVLACALASPAFAQAPQPAKPVDPARFYQGTWREIARRPMRITDGCVAGATAYQARPDGRIGVLDSCQKGTPEGEAKTIRGVGVIQDPGFNAKLKVRYRYLIFPITREYWVLDRADDYSWFISGDPELKDLYIFTRDPQVSAAQRAMLVEKARALGYEVTKLEFPAQPAR